MLETPDGAQRFGSSIAIGGNTVVVGDPEYGNFVGGAFVYVLRAGQHTVPVAARLSASDASIQLGFSVGISGNTIAIGAIGNNSFAGAVYVFVRPPTGWTSMTQTAELTVPTTQEILLGNSVAISGNTIIAGALRSSFSTRRNFSRGRTSFWRAAPRLRKKRRN